MRKLSLIAAVALVASLGLATVAGAAALDLPVASAAERIPSTSSRKDVTGAIVICNHWTQYGIGEAFPEGEVGGRWYQRNFSTVYALEQGSR